MPSSLGAMTSSHTQHCRCRLSQEKEEDFAAWIAATDAFWGTFNQNFPDADRKPHFVVTGR